MTFSKTLLRCVVIACLCVQAVIPVGYMPDTQSAQGFEMVLCGLNGPQKVTVDAAFSPTSNQNDAHPNGDHDMTPSCVFAMMHHTAPPIHEAVIVAVMRYVTSTAVAVAIQENGHDPYRTVPPFAIGPPVMSA